MSEEFNGALPETGDTNQQRPDAAAQKNLPLNSAIPKTQSHHSHPQNIDDILKHVTTFLDDEDEDDITGQLCELNGKSAAAAGSVREVSERSGGEEEEDAS